MFRHQSTPSKPALMIVTVDTILMHASSTSATPGPMTQFCHKKRKKNHARKMRNVTQISHVGDIMIGEMYAQESAWNLLQIVPKKGALNVRKVRG